MRFRQLSLRVQTDAGLYGTKLIFPDGLVVIWADNSMGKSTCARAILVALGMEAVLTTSQTDLPLPPAVTTKLDSDDGEHSVIESEVFLEIQNSKGDCIVVQRSIKGLRDKNLITVHEGPVLSSPGQTVKVTDYFVGRSGAASREAGFHNFLAKFLGWDLPTVQTYDGAEYPLYLQCIFPYFFVEQTRGWSSVSPPIPGHFRIRDAHKRSVEFLLSMEAHVIALRRQELKNQRNQIEMQWARKFSRIEELAEQFAGQLQGVPQRPVAAWPPELPPIMWVSTGDKWISVADRIKERAEKLRLLVDQEIPRVQEITQSAQNDLAAAEVKVREQETLLSLLLNTFDEESYEVGRVQERLTVIDEDIQRNKDVRVLRQLGSRQHSLVDSGNCPVCHQEISDSLLPVEIGQTVMSVDESIEFLTEQRRTYEVVLRNANKVARAREAQIKALKEALASSREVVRSLRRTLVSDARLPSIAALQGRLRLEADLKSDTELLERFEKNLDGFADLSARWREIEAEIMRLPKDDLTMQDQNKIDLWSEVIRQGLAEFGFKSVRAENISISKDTYRPEHDGFDLQNSISASDLIRTVWAYLTGILEMARSQKTNHPGCIVFDEPKQQSAKDVSFQALLRRASTAGDYGQQVIFFTSENPERLFKHLSEIPHSMISVEGRMLKAQ